MQVRMWKFYSIVFLYANFQSHLFLWLFENRKTKQRRNIHQRFFSKKNNIKFTQEKVFDDCIGIKGYPLKFDFYIPSKNICIEYDGKQHFEPIEYFGGKESFKTQTENDKIKNIYCKNNKITLIRLPYTLSNNEINKKILSKIP